MANRMLLPICNVMLVLLVGKGSELSFAYAAQPIFIMEVAQGGMLCAYTGEDQWAQAPKARDPQFIAITKSVRGLLVELLVERDTEDTTTYDRYAVGKDGDIRQLKRILDVVPERVRREQVWNIRGGRASKILELWMEFKTHKPRGPDQDLSDFVENPIIVRMSDFPFYSLITDKHPERWPGGKRCAAGDMNKLEAASAK